ncbi:hypothetical protein [Oceaniglobus trochenteri]|uniref:hypothetical protein n=1 Tax=Oceaniglobus trochenteri TaxID=2763260 RepID=UPI001CFF77A3|nr:hypothetical protein [Oceaniglobus trochenteri]
MLRDGVSATVRMPGGRVVRAMRVAPPTDFSPAHYSFQGLRPFVAVPLTVDDLIAIEAEARDG